MICSMNHAGLQTSKPICIFRCECLLATRASDVNFTLCLVHSAGGNPSRSSSLYFSVVYLFTIAWFTGLQSNTRHSVPNTSVSGLDINLSLYLADLLDAPLVHIISCAMVYSLDIYSSKSKRKRTVLSCMWKTDCFVSYSPCSPGGPTF